MPRPLHKGPIIFAGFFILASIAMTLVGTLPMHLAVTAKVMMLLYAALLFALAFAPVKGQRRTADAKSAAMAAGAAKA